MRRALQSILAFSALSLLVPGSARADDPSGGAPVSPVFTPSPPSTPGVVFAPINPPFALSKPLRAGVEILAVMAPFALRFWLSAPAPGEEPNGPVAFDNDALITNGLLHPLSGSLYYSIPRANDLGAGTSFVYAIGASAVWEVMVEHRKTTSINDLVLTPIAGSAIGEASSRLGGLFYRSARGRAATYVLWPARIVNDTLDHRERPIAPAMDDLGIAADALHRIDFIAGAGPILSSETLWSGGVGVRLDAELLDLPQAAGPGKVSRLLDVGMSSALSLRAGLGQGGLSDFGLFTRVGIVDHYWQDLSATSPSRLTIGRFGPSAIEPDGHRLILGAATAFEYSVRAFSPEITDQLAILNVLGPRIDYSLSSRGVRLRLLAEGYGDFAAVHSLPLDAYVRLRQQDVDHIRTYHFAMGLSGKVRASVIYRGLEVGAGIAGDGFLSAEDELWLGSPDLRIRARIVDWRTSQRFWTSYTPPGQRAQIPWVEVERVARGGALGGLQAAAEDMRLLVGFGASF